MAKAAKTIKVIEQVRYSCALAALHSVLAIDRAVPILHAGPGCGQRLSTALSTTNGYQGTGYAGGACDALHQ